jgi:rare lipoprotein A
LGEAVRVASSAEVGVASYYAHRYHGRPTASGEVFDLHQLTAAHPRYAFGTRVKVTHLGNNRSIIVRINDRGPFIQGRVIDLSLAAAEELQMVQGGLAQVKLEIVQ